VAGEVYGNSDDTKEQERGKNKCAKYWPDENKLMPVLHPSGKGPDMTVLNIKEKQTSDYVIRELEITRESDEKRKIYHFQFKSWPDHGVPKDPGCVLNFLQDINDKQNGIPEAGPVIVHCSAGIGRTGTFIVIDIILTQLEIYAIPILKRGPPMVESTTLLRISLNPCTDHDLCKGFRKS